ncbi:MAG: hypothetical protein ACJ8AD_05030 [Gemmatimonadaceae bacterium]
MKRSPFALRVTLVSTMMLGVVTPPALAQRDDALRVGARYRVTLVKFPERVGPQLPMDRWLAGELVERRVDTLVLRPHPATGLVPVPVAAIDRLEVSRGVSRGVSAFENAFGGAVAGGLTGLFLYRSGLRGTNFQKPWQAVGISAASGAAGGLISGLLFPTERWRRVDKPAVR